MPLRERKEVQTLLWRVKGMIRLFTLLYKMDLNALPSAVEIFKTVAKEFNVYRESCPNCKAKGRLGYHSAYDRDLVAYENGNVQENRVTVRRFECTSCNKTHAALPDVIIPYNSYSIIFIFHVLKAYFFKSKSETVVDLCIRFGIAVTTLYVWKKRYLKHKTLHLGKLEKYLQTQDPHPGCVGEQQTLAFATSLTQPERICFTNILSGFFQKYGFSFLQHSPHIATQSGGT
jgi:hypothetical protein